MPESLYALALLACPAVMGLMMWMMMRGNEGNGGSAEHGAESGGEPGIRSVSERGEAAELDRLRREVDQLQAERAGAGRGHLSEGDEGGAGERATAQAREPLTPVVTHSRSVTAGPPRKTRRCQPWWTVR